MRIVTISSQLPGEYKSVIMTYQCYLPALNTRLTATA